MFLPDTITTVSRPAGLRCRHAFEAVSVHANGEVVCSIIDGRGEFVLGNVFRESLRDILAGSRIRELRRLVLNRRDDYCPAIRRRCPLKNIAVEHDEAIAARLRFLMIEPTTACDLRCLTCPVRDIAGDVRWADAYRDGGLAFLAWDGARRAKQHAVDAVRRVVPIAARGRMPPSRRGTLPLDVLCRVVDEAGAVDRIDLFNYGEPFLYRPLLDALRHIRRANPPCEVVVSTDGMQVRADIEAAIVSERLLDWVVFSVDGVDEDTYARYRIGGRFDVAFANMIRFHRRALGSGVRVVWQYVVFRWNDRDAHFKQAIAMAQDAGIEVWFDFAHTWGRSRRRAADLEYLRPHLRPFTALPGERRDGW